MTETEANDRTVREHEWFDWRKPLVKSVEFLYIVFLDASVIVLLAVITKVTETCLKLLSQDTQSITIGGQVISVQVIVDNGHFFTFLIFMVVAAWHLIKWVGQTWNWAGRK